VRGPWVDTLGVIYIRTGPARSIGASLALALALRPEPNSPVQWRAGYEVSRPSLTALRALIAAGQEEGLDITDNGHQGVWWRRGALVIQGGWQEVSRFASALSEVTGQA
jgi:hypothetical protein